MHDIKWIRENPQAFDAAMRKRGLGGDGALSEAAITLDEDRRTAITRLQELQTRRNEVAKSIGMAKKNGDNADALMQEAGDIKAEIETLQQQTEGEGALENLLATLPNIPADEVPDGADEDANSEIKTVGTKPSIGFEPKQHFDIGEQLGDMDFAQAAVTSGSRFVYLTNQLARLERALAQFMLDMHTTEFGFMEVSPPYLVHAKALYGTGQLPKFEEDLFKTTTDHYLIPTAEVSLANLVNGKILSEEQLPMRLTAHTPCFRSEAGSAGRDTRGLIRQHQFAKVELFSITTPEKSQDEHERMLSVAEEVLKRLGLHYRVMLLCAGDMGFSAEKTYDIEVWLPGQDTFREISSVSNCGAFQSRRMKARFRRAGEQKSTEFPHMLNGSALAVGRTVVAILENYQQADGSVALPAALHPYMGGVTKLELQ